MVDLVWYPSVSKCFDFGIVMFIRLILASELIASKAKLETIKETRFFGSDDADPAEETPNLKRTVTNRSIFPLYYRILWRN